MKLIKATSAPLILLLAPTFVHLAHGQGASSANFQIQPSSIDAGGGAASSSNYTITASRVGGFIGSASSANYDLDAGYVPQLEDGADIDLCDFASWASQFFTPGQPLSGPDDDFDGDGQSNEEEFLALTDPTEVSSFFQIGIIENGANFDIVFSPRQESSLRIYRLLTSPDLSPGPFSPLGISDTASVTGGIFANVAPSGDRRFYQIEISKPSQ